MDSNFASAIGGGKRFLERFQFYTNILRWSLNASLALSVTTSFAWAFDPTAIAMGGQALSGVLGGLDKADEMADIGFVFGDLLSELGVETGTNEEINRAVTRLEGLNAKARELRWNETEIKDALASDLNEANSLKERIKTLRTMISASKRIAEIMGVRPKAGERASQIQNIRINSMILEELQAQRRQQFLAYLEAKEAKSRRDLLLQEIQEKERGKNTWRKQ